MNGWTRRTSAARARRWPPISSIWCASPSSRSRTWNPARRGRVALCRRLQQQESAGVEFSPNQLFWLEDIRDHIASSLAVEPEDLEFDPFSRWGGLGRAQLIFGDRLLPLLNELNEGWRHEGTAESLEGCVP